MNTSMSVPGAEPVPSRKPSRIRPLFLIGGVTALIVVGLSCVLGILLFVFGLLRDHTTTQQAVRLAEADARVTAVTGTPLTTGRFVTGQVSTNNGVGSANLSVPVSGPKGSGTISLAAAQDGQGNWVYSKLVFTPAAGGAVVDLQSGGK